jgi:hypothetical protein
MANKKYQRQPNDGIVEFEGKVYCVKTPWEAIADDDKTFMAKAVEEGGELVDGVFPAVGIEAFKNDDGSWDVIGVWDSERIDECGGGCGALVWSAEKGFQEVV